MTTLSINKNIKDFVCTKCRSELKETDKYYKCFTCNSIWPISCNIPRFAKSEVEWSVFNAEEAKNVVELAEKTSWQEAINAYSHTLGTYTLRYIMDESRSDFHVILPLNSKATVLDIGSGWGNIALTLSRLCRQVYCCDVNLTNLRLLNVRMRDREIDNVMAFQYEPNAPLRLPFSDSSIDVVLLNGVLEWMGSVEISDSPGKLQLEGLKEIRRVLKPQGALYIGIENRYSISTLRGQRVHGELPFVGLFPRLISNLITKLVRRVSHRTYIYSLGGYRRLLRMAGFEQIDFYMPYPSYHHPNYLIPLKPSWVKRFWFDQLSVSRSRKYRLFRRLGLSRLPFHWLAYSFSIRCTK
ncbi:class I SAM-dependent methyltransferase [Thermodesulfobacteriota bacterium]